MGDSPANFVDPTGMARKSGGGGGGYTSPTCDGWAVARGLCTPGSSGSNIQTTVSPGSPNEPVDSPDFLSRCGVPIALLMVGIVFALLGLGVNPGIATAVYDMHTTWIVDAAGMLQGGHFLDFVGMIFDIFITIYWSFIAPTLGWFGAAEVALGLAKDLTPMGVAIEVGMMLSSIAVGVMSLAADNCL